MQDHKKNIIDMLKKYGRSSTSKIAFVALSYTNSWSAEKILMELMEEGIVEREKETNATYWKLKEDTT